MGGGGGMRANITTTKSFSCRLKLLLRACQFQYGPGAVVGVLHVGDTDGGVADPVVDHRVHWGGGIILPTCQVKLGERNSNCVFYWQNEPLFPLKSRQGTRQLSPDVNEMKPCLRQ